MSEDIKNTTRHEADGFLKTVYSDWRDKTSATHFTLIFVLQLCIWNWDLLLVFFASDFSTWEKLMRISALKASLAYQACRVFGPLITAMFFAAILPMIQWGFARLFAPVIKETKLAISQNNASLKWASKKQDEEEERAYLEAKNRKEEERKSAADAEREANEAERLAEEEAIRKQKDATSSHNLFIEKLSKIQKDLNSFDRALLKAFDDHDGKIHNTAQYLTTLADELSWDGELKAFNPHRIHLELHASLEKLKQLQIVSEYSPNAYSISRYGYYLMDLIKDEEVPF